MLKKLCILLFIITALCPKGVGAAGIFSDIAGDELEAAVEELYGAGIVTGTADGVFSPNDPVSRADFCVMIARAVGGAYDGTADFSDVGADAYYSGAVAYLCGRGIVSGYDGKFRPNDSVTVSEAAKILVSLYESIYGEIIYDSSSTIGGTDRYAEIEPWAKRYIIRAFMLGFVPRLEITSPKSGAGADNFEPNAEVSRLHAAEIIYNFTVACKNTDRAKRE